MLAGMLVQRARVLWFTLGVVALFMVGCGAAAGAGQDPDMPESTANEAGLAREVPAPQPTVAAAAPALPPDTQVQAGNVGGYEDTDPSALTAFRGDLDPHGTWVEDPVYGTVWVPARAEVGADFAPYVTAGHWALTEEGDWLWVSDYSWGWVAFHYGRWVWIPGTGWAWIPGRAYAPAWVVWRVGEPGYEYIGWAPMPPTYYWSGGVAVALWVVPPAPYVFCETAYVFDPYPHSHLIVGVHVHEVAYHTHYYHGGYRHGSRPHRYPSGPTPSEARIPASAIPRTAARPDPRAVAAARPANSTAGRMSASARPSMAAAPAAGRNVVRPAARGLSEPTFRGQGARSVAPTRRAPPLATAPAYPAVNPSGSDRGWGRTSAGRPAFHPSSPPQPGQPSYGHPSYGRPSHAQPTHHPPSYRQQGMTPAGQQPYRPTPRNGPPVVPYGSARGGSPGGSAPAPTVAPVKPSSRPAAAPSRGRVRGRR